MKIEKLMAKGFSKPEAEFVSKYLSSGLGKKKANEKTIDAYKAYLAASKEALVLIGTIASATGDAKSVIPIQKMLEDAKAKLALKSPDFGAAADLAAGARNAAKGIAPEIAAAVERKAHLERLFARLSDTPAMALPKEKNALDAVRQQARQALSPKVPTEEQHRTAADALLRLEQVHTTVSADAKARADAHEALRRVLGRCSAAAARIDSKLGGLRSGEIRPALSKRAASAGQILGEASSALSRMDHGAIARTVAPCQRAEPALAALEADVDVALRCQALLAKLDRIKDEKTRASLAKAEQAVKVTLGAVALPRVGGTAKFDVALDTAAKEIDAAVATQMKGDLGKFALDARETAAVVALGLSDPAAFDAARTALENMEAVFEVERLQKAINETKDSLKFIPEITRQMKESFDAARERETAFRALHGTALATPDHPDHMALKKKLESLVSQKNREGEGLEETLKDALAERVKLENLIAEEAAARKRQAEAEAAARGTVKATPEGKRAMLNAISFGPLSPDHGRRIGPPAAADLLALCGRDPELAGSTLSAAQFARSPASVVACAGMLKDRLDKQAATPDTPGPKISEDYAHGLLRAAGNVDEATLAQLGPYLDSGRFTAPLQLGGGKSAEDTEQARSSHVASRVAQAKGDGLDIAAGRDAVLDLLFHPTAIDPATPMLADQAIRTLDFLEGAPEAQKRVAGLGAPKGSGADLVRRATGLAQGQPGAGDTRQAVLGAMMTPVYQGKVGSCFATCGVRRLQQTDPGRMLDQLATIAEEGVYEPAKGDPIHAVRATGEGNPLIRSLEYSAATATARNTHSTVRGKIAQSNLASLKSAVDGGKIPEAQAVLFANAMSTCFTIDFDPDVAVGATEDQSSERGRYVLRGKSGKLITNTDEYIAELPSHIADMLSDGTLQRQLFEYGLRADGQFPWAMSAGGQTDEAMAVILGVEGRTEGFSEEVKKAGLDSGARTTEIFSALVDRFSGVAGPMTTMRTVGQHGFSGLPDHPSLAPLFEGGEGRHAANIQRELLDKAAAVAKTLIPLDRLVYMYDEDVERTASRLQGKKADADRFIAEVRNARPTRDMTPKDYSAHVQKVFTGPIDKALRALPLEPGEKDDEARKRKIAQDAQKDSAVTAAFRLLNDLPLPQFVIADTNWGRADSHQYFVITANPITGEPQLCQKVEPGGALVPHTDADDWVRRQWALVR